MYNIKDNFKNNEMILLLKELKKAQIKNNYDKIKTLPALLYLLHCLHIKVINLKQLNMTIASIIMYVLYAIDEDFLIFSYSLLFPWQPRGFLFYDIKNNYMIKSENNILDELKEYKKLNKKEYIKIIKRINAENN